MTRATSSAPITTADADGIPNRRDLDSDNDGLTDHYECGGTDDADKDGEVDSKVDADENGLVDEYDPGQGGNMLKCADTDGDGIADFLDINSDDQGGSDYDENRAGPTLTATGSPTPRKTRTGTGSSTYSTPIKARRS